MLRNIRVEIHREEVFGIVRRNGMRKSEFNPKPTGSETIFLNSTLLGFSRREMQERFGRIVDFTELGQFIDAPIRTYSSGMVARLGFAIAADVRPDILIVDEVLAVGDEVFRRKSKARMQEFRDQGATIVFVSHDASTIRAVCARAVWIDHGVVKADGASGDVVEAYLVG